MRTMYIVLLICLVSVGVIGTFSSPCLAIDAYFDTEVSTRLEPEPNYGTVTVTRMEEEVPQVFPDITYEPVIYLEIIFDASKTMNEPDLNGVRKIDIARELVTILVNHFPQQDTRFALRVNGGKFTNNCLDTELVVPFSRNNASEVLNAMKTIQPKGLSPITYSLRQVLNDFEGLKGTKIVFLITDGQDTCDNEPADPCTTTMDLFLQAEFDGTVNILGVNTINDDAQLLLSCLRKRSRGDYLDTNRNKGTEFAQLIRQSQQLGYSISKVLNHETLAEGKILELLNRRIGDITVLEGDNIVLSPERDPTKSSHQLAPGVYKIEFATVPPLATYFTLDKQQELTIALVRSGTGIDVYDRAHLALGNQYYDAGEYAKAQEEYQKVIAFDPNNVDAHLNLGIIYDDIVGDKTKAAEHYKAYLELQGPRQEEVRSWLRKVRGEPSREEELEAQRKKREEEKAQQEAEQLAAKAAEQQEKERQKGIAAYEEVLTANPPIRKLDQEEVIAGDVIHVTVSETTTDSDAQKIALDVGNRTKRLLNRTPKEILVFRENAPELQITRATFDAAQNQYVITP